MTRRICQWTANPREKAQGMEMEPQKTNSHRQEKIFLKCKCITISPIIPNIVV